MRVGEVFETRYGHHYRCWKIVRRANSPEQDMYLIADHKGMTSGEFMTDEDEPYIFGTSNLLMSLYDMAQAATIISGDSLA